MQKQLIDALIMASCKNLYAQFTFTDNQKARSVNFTYKNLITLINEFFPVTLTIVYS